MTHRCHKCKRYHQQLETSMCVWDSTVGGPPLHVFTNSIHKTETLLVHPHPFEPRYHSFFFFFSVMFLYLCSYILYLFTSHVSLTKYFTGTSTRSLFFFLFIFFLLFFNSFLRYVASSDDRGRTMFWDIKTGDILSVHRHTATR